MTIAQLNYIVALDTHRHFATAAAHCFVSQPTLSMQVQKLEQELGILLFDRSKQPVIPTTVGTAIIAHARVLLGEVGKIQELAQSSTGELSGSFRLGIIPTVAPSLLPLFLSRFSRQHPAIELRIEELQTNELLAALDKDQLDAGIAATPLERTGIHEETLYQEPFMAFVPPMHRLAEEEFVLQSDLDLNDVLLLKEGHCFRNNVLNLCGANTTKAGGFAMESGSFSTLIALSKQGFGMTLLPYLEALSLSPADKKLLKPLDHPKPAREISLIYSRTQAKLRMLEALKNAIRNALPEKLAKPANYASLSPLP